MIRVLGPVSLTGPGGEVDLGARRHREVLAALAVDAGQVVAVDTLLDRVWGGDAAPSPTTLHAVVSRLRGTLREVTDAPCLLTQAPGYRLDLDACDVDARELASGLVAARRLLGAGRPGEAREPIAAALDLWRGTPYADVRGDFATVEAARLEEQRLSAHELLAEIDLALGRTDALLATLPRLVAEHPLREPLRGALMVALYRAGRQADALASYDEGRAALAEELGLDPGPDLQRLHARVLRHDPTLLPEPTAAPVARPDPVPSGDRMVGRVAELARVREAVGRGLQGSPSLVAVAGEAGIGKTRLVQELLRDLPRADRGAGPVVAAGQCWEHEGAPALWPWEQALTALVAELGLEHAVAVAAERGAVASGLLGRLVPSLGGAEPADGSAPEVDRVRLFEAVAGFLQDVTAERPALLVLEDLHWADPESVSLLDYLSGALRSGRLAVVLTVRDPAGRPDTVEAEVLAVVARASGAEVVPLTGLPVEDVAELVGRHVGAPVRDAVAAGLRERTDGNPFYLVELTRLYDEERQATGRADVPVPSGVRAVIEGRLRHLDPGDRELLTAAAVVGRDFDPLLLAEVVGRDPGALAEALDRLGAAGLVQQGGPAGEQRFSHALVQEVLEAGAGPVRRASWHAQVAEALVRRGTDPAGHAAEIAHHYLEAGVFGDPARGIEHAVVAADQAERRLAPREAERLLRRALGAVGGLPATSAAAHELDIRLRLAALLSRRLGYDHPDVLAARRRAADLARSTGSGEQLTSVLWGTWGSALVAGDLPAAELLAGQLRDASARIGTPELAVAVAQAFGQTRLLQGRLEEALASLTEGVVLVDDLPGEAQPRLDLFVQDPAVVIRGWLAATLALRGEVADSDAVATQALARATVLAHPYTSAYLEILMGWRAAWLDRPEAALTHTDRALAIAEEAGFDQFRTFALGPGAWARARLGDPVRAEHEARAAAEVYAGEAPHMFGTLIAWALGTVQHAAGDTSGALATLDRAVLVAGRTGEVVVLAALHRARAEVLAALGRTDDAAAAWARAREVATSQGARLFLT
jgi:DNA-binding SARP family transcriptional activator